MSSFDTALTDRASGSASVVRNQNLPFGSVMPWPAANTTARSRAVVCFCSQSRAFLTAIAVASLSVSTFTSTCR